MIHLCDVACISSTLVLDSDDIWLLCSTKIPVIWSALAASWRPLICHRAWASTPLCTTPPGIPVPSDSAARIRSLAGVLGDPPCSGFKEHRVRYHRPVSRPAGQTARDAGVPPFLRRSSEILAVSENLTIRWTVAPSVLGLSSSSAAMDFGYRPTANPGLQLDNSL